MNKIVFILLVLISKVLSYDISMNKVFVTKLKPNSLTISVNISTIQKNSKDVMNILSDYSEFIKAFKELDIKGGEFDTFPQYRYSNSQSKMIGYKGNLGFRIKSSNEEKLKDFISMLTAKNIDKNVQLSISSRSWNVNQDKIKKEQDKLMFKALNWADSYAKKLSDKTGKMCHIKSVNFGANSYNPPIVYAQARVESDKSIPIPKKDMQEIKIHTNIKFECK